MATIGNLWINVKSNTKGLAKGLSKSKGMLGKFGKFAASPAGLAVAGFAALTAGVYAAGKAVKFAIKEFMAFEAAMAEVKSILLDIRDSDFARLEDSAKKLGATTSFTAEQAANGMANLARAGFSTNEILSATPAVLDLAAATGMELAEAANIAAVAVRGFGMEAAETAHVADVLAVAASKTNTTVQEIGDAMSYVAPVANQLGFSIEETSAMLGKLADAGIKGSKGGTALRTIMLKLGGTIEKEGTGALRKYLEAQHSVTENMEKFGKIGVTAAGVLSSVTDETEALTEAMVLANDVVGKMADTRLDTLEGDTKLLSSAISGLAIAVGEELSPAFRTGTQAATGFFAGLTEGFNELNTKAQEGGVQMNLWNGILLVLADVLHTVTGVVKLLWNAFQYAFYKIGALVISVVGGIIKLFELLMLGWSKVLIFLGKEVDTTAIDQLHAASESMAKDAVAWNETAVAQAEEGVHAVTTGLVGAYSAQHDAMFGAGEAAGKNTADGVVAGIEGGIPKVEKALEELTDVQMELVGEGTKLKEKLQEQIKFFGMSEAQILNAKAAEEDLTSAHVAQTIALEKELQALKDTETAKQKAIRDGEGLASAAQKIIESLRTPEQVYTDEVAGLQKMVDAKLLTLEQFDQAVQKLSKGTEDDIEVNIITKGIVEGLDTALGTVKIAGQVNKTEMLAEKANSINEKIASVMGAVKTDLNGLQDKIQAGVSDATIKMDNKGFENAEALLKTSNEIGNKQWDELKTINKNILDLNSNGALV